MQNETIVQSNSMRGNEVQSFVRRIITEMLEDLAPAFGPGASDYFLVKDGANYYTRDGMEISESLRFDNELANRIHNIMFQAADRQGKKVGDGTTTMFLYYCFLYLELYNQLYTESRGDICRNINWIRREWGDIVAKIQEKLKEQSVPMTEELLLSMLFTCTQDAELAASIYQKLRKPIMEGAYIIPRKSNIATDFEVTTYMNPLFKATKQYELRSMTGKRPCSTVLYCNGTLDVANHEVFLSLIQRMLATVDQDGNETPVTIDVVILCHGISECTRRTLRTVDSTLRDLNIDPRADTDKCNNLVIFTLDDYRNFSSDELEDLATIITDEPGIGGLVQPLTYECLLYKAFYPVSEKSPAIERLERFDMDPHLVDKMREMFREICEVEYDEVEGLALHKNLGPHAQVRYNELRRQIDEEKSDVRRVALNRRLKKSYGMFIDIQIGSALLKDSQRKYELILDAIISAATGVREGVIVGNSILHTIRIINEIIAEKTTPKDEGDNVPYVDLETAMLTALTNTMGVMISNDSGEELNMDDVVKHGSVILTMLTSGEYDIKDFNLTDDQYVFWHKKVYNKITEVHRIPMEDGTFVNVPNVVVEPYDVMAEVLENSIMVPELLKTRVFHIAGTMGYMNNFIK